jgi:hypothetical protein
MMYLELQDIFMASLAMLLSLTLVFTTAWKNYKMEQSVKYWRSLYYEEKARWRL